MDRQWIFEDGKIKDEVIQFIRSRKGKYKLILQKYRQDSSSRQNRYYWAYLHIIRTELGDDENSLHEYFKRALLPPKFITALGKEIKIPASTTKLDKVEFNEYITKIEVECGVPAPDPNDLYI
jgi:hypothetical protein